MKNPAKILYLLSVAALLASCTGGSDSPTSSQNPSSGDSDTSVSSHATSVAEQFVILVHVTSGVHVNLSQNKASKGEKITFTVTLDAGFILNAIKANGSTLTPNASGVYSFTMPNRSVEITADVTMDGEVTISGGVSAVLEEETAGSGLFVARNVRVEETANITLTAFGKVQSAVNVDHNKCFADLSVSVNKTVSFVLAGGSTYDFFYDVNADPEAGNIYVRRVKVDTLPSDPDSLLSLFDGYSRSASTVNPGNVLSVAYHNGATNIDYAWSNFADGSLGVATNATNHQQIGVNYRKIADGVLESADTYVEYKEHRVPGTSEKVASGKYKIEERAGDIQQGYGRFCVSRSEAEFIAHQSGHFTEAIRYDLMDGFFTGWDSEFTDGLGLNARSIVSEVEEGGFKVTLDSYREIDTTNVTLAAETEVSYYKYDAVLHFDDAGKFLSASYTGKRYGQEAYNFQTHTLFDANTFTLVDDLQVTYTYGEALGEINYDTSALFSSSISATITDNHVTDEALKTGNHIAVTGDDAGATFNAHMTLNSNLGEEEFIDMDNYTIISFDNADIVDYRSKTDPFTLLPVGEGTVNLTIGNPAVPSVPRITISVSVEDATKVHGFYMTGENGRYTDLLDSADSFTMPAGRVYRFRVLGSPNDIKNVMFTPVSSDPSVLEVSRYVVDHQAYIKFDATNANITEVKHINVTLNSDRYDAGWGPKVFSVTVTPNSGFSPFGDWYLVSSFESATSSTVATIDRTTTAHIVDYDPTDAENTLSVITTGAGTAKAKEYKFGFNINNESGEYIFTKVSGGNIEDIFIAETVDNLLGIALVADDAYWGGMDDVTDGTQVLGYVEYDEGLVINISYDSFDYASNWDL